MLKKDTFVCSRCGECCRLLIRIGETEIQDIERLGYSRFTMRDPSHMTDDRYLKQDKDGWCVFFRKNQDGTSCCSIYPHRPAVCRCYPFHQGVTVIEECKPRNMLKKIAGSTRS